MFVRAYGFSIGKVNGINLEVLAAEAWKTAAGQSVQRIHVWERDRAKAGEHDFEPSITPQAVEAHHALVQSCPCPETLAAHADDPLRPARRRERILDCILVASDLWWVGYHRVGPTASRYPGGMMALELPAEIVSRTWLKMEEALRWSRLPIPHDARVAEIGSARASRTARRLLARGYTVTGVDPAEMAPSVLQHPRFTHIRKRSTQVRRREFRKIRWLTADMNVAPNYTLTAVEAIVTHPEINIRGLLSTLKLPELKLADHVPEYLERIRNWGYNNMHPAAPAQSTRNLCGGSASAIPAEDQYANPPRSMTVLLGQK